MFRDLFDVVPDALIVVDGDGRIVIANPQAAQLFGYAASEMVAMEIESLMPDSARARHRAHRDAYTAQPHPRPMGASGQSLVGMRRDGSAFPVEIALSPLDSDGEPRYLASVRDVSDSQRVRQSLLRAGYDGLTATIGQLALEAENVGEVIDQAARLLAGTLDVEGVVVAFLQGDGHTVDIRAAHGSDVADVLEGLDNEALAQALMATTSLVVDDFADLATDASPAPRFPVTTRVIASGALLPLVDRDRGAGALIAVSRRPQRFDHDAMHLLQSVANVISALVQRRRMEEQLAHAQRLDALGQLTGGIAHDFNNLLTVMSGSLQLLELECGPNPAAEQLIASALRSVARGADLTGKLLAFARRQRLMPRAVDLSALLHDVQLMLKRTLGDAVVLALDCTDALPAVFADPTQLDSAIVNLTLNARDALPRGGSITIQARDCVIANDRATPELPVGTYLCVSVIDTGRGMAPDTLARAMEPFFTTKDLGRGSGLGLSMVYGFARQSGGHLRIDSALGKGTRVDLYLPAARTAALPSIKAVRHDDVGTGERVLVVEDDAAVRDIAVAFLRGAGYRVDAVDTGEGALQILTAETDIALLFSDVMLGEGMDGKALAVAARTLRPALAVLLTTGDEAQVQKPGFDLLRKPYLREQLVARARVALTARPVSASD